MTITSESVSCDLTVQSDWLASWILARGQLDTSVVSGLQSAIDEVLQRSPRKVHVILSDVTYIDIAALEALALADERARAQGCKLVIRRPAPAVVQLLASTGFKDRLTISKRLTIV